MPSIKQTHVREFRSLVKYVNSVLPEIAKPSSEHIALLIFLLQVMSSVITAMVKHKFWTPLRDQGLDVFELTRTLPPELLNRAGTDASDEFWNSPDIEPMYWPLHLRAMLQGGKSLHDKKNPGEYIALQIRANTVAPVAHRLLDILEQVFSCSPAVARNSVMSAFKLNVHAFLRRKVLREQDEDMDPRDTMARNFHLREFSGEVSDLTPEAKKHLHKTLKHISDTVGPEVAKMLELAAIQAGMQNESNFSNEEASVISKASVQEAADCGRLLLTQMQNVKLALAIMHALGIHVDDEAAFHANISDVDNAEEEFFGPALTAVSM